MISLLRSVLALVVLFVLVTRDPTVAQQGTNTPETKSAAAYHPGSAS